MNSLLKFITCGSVDDGKSTLIGHILYDAKLLFADQEETLLLDSKVGSAGGEIDYSLLLDGLMAEREQGITIDVAYRYFTTQKRSFIVADTPGHEEYTRNMAVGASFAELAVILVDAEKGVLIQTRRHARICEMMGIRHFVFAINKMDLVGYSQTRYLEIERQVNALASELRLQNTHLIPVSATKGDNITTKSPNMSWYEGEPLLTFLEEVDTALAESEEGFYLPIQRVCRPDHTFRGFQGQIAAGSVQIGDELTILPGGEKANVIEILNGDKSVSFARAGWPVTVRLDREVDVSRGCVLQKGTHIKPVKAFYTTLLWMDDTALVPGKEFIIKLGTRRIGGRIREILYRTDINTGEHIPAESITKNEIARCFVVLDAEIPADRFSEHKVLGELILIDRISNMTSACGVINEVTECEEQTTARVTDGDLEAGISLFDEYFYYEDRLNVENLSATLPVFHVGDQFTLSGESYKYPPYFDILAIPSGVAIEIRDGKVEALKRFSDYRYAGLPVVNESGFSIALSSADDLQLFLEEVQTKNKQQVLEKWMSFETFRRIIFNSNNWVV
ncbi:MAG: sulfate adenylyltransferase [Eubacterium sp.]|nr:sulfate adenylyltransferase [Eubacterium sp.]